MAKRVRRSTQAKAKPKVSDTIEVTLKSERYQLEKGKGGHNELVPHPWNQTVRINGKRYTSGETFACPKQLAKQLLAAGQAVQAGKKAEPIMPVSHQDKETILMEGVVRRDDVEGKVPVYDPEKGNKGEWEEINDFDD